MTSLNNNNPSLGSLISSIQWLREKGQEREVESKVFDFGGQEIFNFIHPIFQTSQHSIVILVANVFAPNAKKQMKKHKEIQKQIGNLKNIYEEILLVLKGVMISLKTRALGLVQTGCSGFRSEEHTSE